VFHSVSCRLDMRPTAERRLGAILGGAP
jgi:hypothetical protein